MRVIFFGTPGFAVPTLKALLDAGHEVILAVTQPDKVKGRGHKLSMPAVKEFALSRGITVSQPYGVKTDEFYESLASLNPDVAVVAAYGRILPKRILELPSLGCINVHGSLLPKYRGAAPIQRAIMNGDEVTGITTMLMNEGLDTGDMLMKEEVRILPEDTAESLSARLSETGASLLVRTLEAVESGTLSPEPQTGEASYAPPLKKEEGRIKWNSAAKSISCLIRGTYPWPGAWSSINGEKVGIVRASHIASDRACVPGRIERLEKDSFCVCTGNGLIEVFEVKPEGKSRMSAAAFARGRRLTAGVSFDLS